MKITLYTTHCPKCTVIEKKLTAAHLDFETCEDQEIMKKKGFNTAPIVEVDGKNMEFKEAVDWIKTVKEG